MNYDKNYFENIERHAPFSYLSPFTKRSKVFRRLVLDLIRFTENRFAKSRANWISRKHNPRSSLDVGTGSGKLVQELLKKNVDAFGIDISQFQINNLTPGLKKRILHGNISNLPFEDKKFDVVSAFQVLEHIEKAELNKSLQEMARISRQYLILEMPTLENYNASIDPTHVSILVYQEWLSIINDAVGSDWKIIRFRKPNYLLPLLIIYSRK